MNNAIQLITKYSSKAWDKTYKRESISSILDGDKDLLKFTGVKTVRIAKFASSGLKTYARPNNGAEGRFGGDGHDTTMATGMGYGYQQGDASLTWEEFTISCDRAVQLRIELFDDEETDGLAVAAATSEVSRTKVIPEVDAYVFSKLVEYAGTVVRTPIAAPVAGQLGYQADGPIQALNDGFLALAEAEVPEEDQIIFCSSSFYNKLRSTNEIVKTLRQTEYGENVKFTIGEYEGREILSVPSTRFKTLIDLLNNNEGGYGWKAGSENIDFIIVAKSAVFHVTKYDKVKVFSPNVVQDFDGYKVNIRVYHDVFVPDNKRAAIYAHVSGTPAGKAEKIATSLNYTYDGETDTLRNVYTLPGDILATRIYATAAKQTVGAAVAEGAIEVLPYAPTGLPAATYHLCATHGGVVTAVAEKPFVVAIND